MVRKLSGDQIVYLEIEKSRIEREKAQIVLNKSVSLYILFMFVGAIGFVYDYFNATMLNVLVVLGIVILLIGTIPYLLIVNKEEKKIKSYLERLK